MSFCSFYSSLQTLLSQKPRILKQCGRLYGYTVYRTLLSESITRMEQYKRQRIFRVDYLQHQGKVELFEALAKLSSAEEAKQSAFKLIDATHYSQTTADCQIVENGIKLLMTRTNSESNEFSFGANVMRMYHYFNMPDEGFRAYKNEELGDLFQDNTSHLILMDLLYKHGQYSRAVEVFFGMKKFNINGTTLFFGSLYHINTAESLTKSQSFLVHISTHYALSRRAVLFAAMHALNQGDPDRALETLKFCKPETVAKNIMLTSLCKLHRVKDVLSILLEIQHKTNVITNLWGLRIYRDAWQEVLVVIENESTEEERAQFDGIRKKLECRGVLSPQTTNVFLERVIPGDFDYKKERAKRIIHRSSSKHTS